MITTISRHFFPCDKHPVSEMATSTLILAIVSVALLTIACTLHWGPAAYGSLAGITGLSLIALLAVIKKSHMQKNKKLNKQSLVQTRREMTNTLYKCAKQGNVSAFRKALAKYDKDTLSCLCSSSDDTLIYPEGRSHPCLLLRFLLDPDTSDRVAFLTSTLEAFDAHTFHAEEYIYNHLLSIEQDTRLIELVIAKFDRDSLYKLFDIMTKNLIDISNSDLSTYSVWLDILIDKWPEKFFKEAMTGGSDIVKKLLIDRIEHANLLSHEAKTRYTAVLST